MAESTANRTAALVAGPTWWGHRWTTRTGQSIPLRDSQTLREQRAAESILETQGLLTALESLPETCVLILPGTRGAARLAATWASERHRQTLPVPHLGDGTWTLAVDVVTGLVSAGYACKALLCTHDGPVPGLADLKAAGLFVRLILPAVPEPEPSVDVLDAPAAV